MKTPRSADHCWTWPKYLMTRHVSISSDADPQIMFESVTWEAWTLKWRLRQAVTDLDALMVHVSARGLGRIDRQFVPRPEIEYGYTAYLPMMALSSDAPAYQKCARAHVSSRGPSKSPVQRQERSNFCSNALDDIPFRGPTALRVLPHITVVLVETLKIVTIRSQRRCNTSSQAKTARLLIELGYLLLSHELKRTWRIRRLTQISMRRANHPSSATLGSGVKRPERST